MTEGFAPIPEGWFRMGSDDGPDDERPAHRVWVDAFEMAVHPVTCEQHEAFLRATATNNRATGRSSPPLRMSPSSA